MKQFISDYTGLCNKLETLILAYAIRDCFGHEINLDWPELNSFCINGIRHRKFRWFNRFGCIKVRECPEELFATLGKFRNINLRGIFGGDPQALDRQLGKVVEDLRLHPGLACAIRKLFSSLRESPVVGVHLRRGDFTSSPTDVYDLGKKVHTAVPGWWISWAMEQIKKIHPGVKFYLSFTGNPESHAEIIEKFDCIHLRQVSPYTYKGPSHASSVDPVADLFALGCCRTILATPVSSFSHWAANVLGEPSIVLMPPPFTEKASPRMVQAHVSRQRLPAWLEASRKGVGTKEILPEQIPVPLPPFIDWL